MVTNDDLTKSLQQMENKVQKLTTEIRGEIKVNNESLERVITKEIKAMSIRIDKVIEDTNEMKDENNKIKEVVKKSCEDNLKRFTKMEEMLEELEANKRKYTMEDVAGAEVSAAAIVAPGNNTKKSVVSYSEQVKKKEEKIEKENAKKIEHDRKRQEKYEERVIRNEKSIYEEMQEIEVDEEVKARSYQNVLEKSLASNLVGAGSYQNVLEKSLASNLVGAGSYQNVLEKSLASNLVGAGSYQNVLEKSLASQSVGAGSYTVAKLEQRLMKLNKLVLFSSNKSTYNVKNENFQMFSPSTTKNTKKCQPSEWDRQDLIQTWPVPHRGLTRTKIKINKTKKLKNKNATNSTNVTLPSNDNITVVTKKKKCQSLTSDGQDLIKTWPIPSTEMTRPKRKIQKKKKLKIKNEKYFSNVTLVKMNKLTKSVKLQTKTKKCQYLARDRQDLIKTWPVPDTVLTRPNKKIFKKKKTKIENHKYFPDVTLVKYCKLTRSFKLKNNLTTNSTHVTHTQLDLKPSRSTFPSFKFKRKKTKLVRPSG